MKIGALVCLFGFLVMGCDDPPQVQRDFAEPDAEADASAEENLPPICVGRNINPCYEMPVENGCIQYSFGGFNEHVCYGEPGEWRDGRVVVVACDCEDCVHVTLGLLGGGEQTCGEECLDKSVSHTTCPMGWEGE